MKADPTNSLSLKIDGYERQDFDAYIEYERPEMLDFIPKNTSKMLDVGCALGSFGKRLKAERSIEVWGVEINEHAASVASQCLDKVLCGAFDDRLDLPKHYFDCITFNDVLEHFVDPYSALIYAKNLLAKDGKIVASIPNVRYFDNMWKLLVEKDWEYTEHGILDRTHLRFFTQKSIVSTFKSLGYSIDRLQGIGALESGHPHLARKYKILNSILFGRIADMRYLQFAVVASPNDVRRAEI
jgi:2-polyprenyl-3-methyl-5-hydroxy-6-metoxy-1,4-benzoquinol methylase